MASNTATDNVSNQSSSFSKSNQNTSLESSKRFVESDIKRDFPVTYQLADNANPNANDILYRIEVAGKQDQGPRVLENQELNKRSSSYIYGNYWQVSIPVESLATLEAQQLMQMDLKVTNSDVTSHQGNEAYSAPKNILEPDVLATNDQETLVDEEQVNLSINIIA